MKKLKVLWTTLGVSGITLPVYCMKLHDMGQFDPLKWEIRINRKLHPTAAVIAMLHEWYHARRYLDNHLEPQSEEVELMCDTFAKDCLEVLDGRVSGWELKWEDSQAEWKELKLKASQSNAPSCSTSKDDK